MFKSIKRLLAAATVILAVSTPSAYARILDYGPPAGSQTSGQAKPSIGAAKRSQLDQLQPSVAQRSASEGGRPSAASTVHPTEASSPQDGFQWDDAAIGAAGVLALIGVGAGATLVIRRRTHEPLAS
jgi:hypothetical protein